MLFRRPVTFGLAAARVCLREELVPLPRVAVALRQRARGVYILGVGRDVGKVHVLDPTHCG